METRSRFTRYYQPLQLVFPVRLDTTLKSSLIYSTGRPKPLQCIDSRPVSEVFFPLTSLLIHRADHASQFLILTVRCVLRRGHRHPEKRTINPVDLLGPGSVSPCVVRSRQETAAPRDCQEDREMSLSVRNVEYFYVRIHGAPETAYEVLAQLASEEVNLLAFSAVPFGPNHVELTIFPDQGMMFIQLAKKLEWQITGPLHALLVQGDDHLGTLAEIQRMLRDAGVSIYASSGVTDGTGRYGYVIYLKEEDHRRAATALTAATLPKISAQ